MNDLKRIVLESVSNPGHAAKIIQENPNLFAEVQPEGNTPHEHVVLNINGNSTSQDESSEVHDISHEAEDDSLSIEKKEKELILRALRKNNNKRKYAARDLGISERTLYRKIKEYELEE